MPRELFLPVTRSLSRYCLGQCRVIHDCCLGSKYGGWRRSLQRHFVQVLVSRKSSVNVCSVVLGATAVEPASRQPSKRVGVRGLCIDAKRPLEKGAAKQAATETRATAAYASQKVPAMRFTFTQTNDCGRRRWVVVTGMQTSDATQHAGDLLATPANKGHVSVAHTCSHARWRACRTAAVQSQVQTVD